MPRSHNCSRCGRNVPPWGEIVWTSVGPTLPRADEPQDHAVYYRQKGEYWIGRCVACEESWNQHLRSLVRAGAPAAPAVASPTTTATTTGLDTPTVRQRWGQAGVEARQARQAARAQQGQPTTRAPGAALASNPKDQAHKTPVQDLWDDEVAEEVPATTLRGQSQQQSPRQLQFGISDHDRRWGSRMRTRSAGLPLRAPDDEDKGQDPFQKEDPWLLSTRSLQMGPGKSEEWLAESDTPESVKREVDEAKHRHSKIKGFVGLPSQKDRADNVG